VLFYQVKVDKFITGGHGVYGCCINLLSTATKLVRIRISLKEVEEQKIGCAFDWVDLFG
jgi:hypothetical protein